MKTKLTLLLTLALSAGSINAASPNLPALTERLLKICPVASKP